MQLISNGVCRRIDVVKALANGKVSLWGKYPAFGVADQSLEDIDLIDLRSTCINHLARMYPLLGLWDLSAVIGEMIESLIYRGEPLPFSATQK